LLPPLYKITRTALKRQHFRATTSGNNNCKRRKTGGHFPMQLRLLTTEIDRSVFRIRLEEARAHHGSSFRENNQFQSINRRRLDCSRLYGLFQNGTASAKAMIAGIAMHDLRSFPQSCDEPDLSHLSPDNIVECSDHWSLSSGAGMLAWVGLAVPLRLLGIQAVLAYLAVGENACAHAGFYELMGFVPAGSIVPHPFVEDARGEKLLVQPVIVDGEALTKGMSVLSEACIEYSDDARIFHLKNSVRSLVRLASVSSTPLSAAALANIVESRATQAAA
jgi:hypothetical protein